MNPRWLWLGGALAGALSCVRVAAAAPCGRADLLQAFPPDGAVGVPLDATLSAHYTGAAEYLGETVSFGLDGAAVPVDASFDSAEGMLRVTPSGPLAADSQYEVDWPSLRGLNSAAPGTGGTVRFTTGSTTDTEAPSFEGLTSIAFDTSHERDECTDSIEDRYQFRLGLGDASDDGGRDGLTLLIFQTSGPNIPDGSPEPVVIGAVPDASSITVKRAVSDAVGRICFAGIVRDLTGKISASGDREVCTTTADPPGLLRLHRERLPRQPVGGVAARGAGGTVRRAPAKRRPCRVTRRSPQACCS